MKILSINLFLNRNKFYFSGKQNENNHFLQKSEEKTEQLPQLDVLTSRVYYKFVNNNQINFGENLDNKADKKAKELQILNELEKALLSGQPMTTFCKENGYTISQIRNLLNKNKAKAQEIKQKKLKQQKKLNEKILKNHETGGDIEKFCKRNDISTFTYYKRLNLFDIKSHRRSFTDEQEKELCKKIQQNHEVGGNISNFCKENGITAPTYYYRLDILGLNPSRRLPRRTKEETKELDKKIRKNHRVGGNVENFCKENGIKISTYGAHSRKMGINCEEEQKKRKKRLDEKILKNHETGGNVKQFCEKNGIKVDTYYLHLKKLGINILEIKQQQRQELAAKILKNHQEKGNVEKFCKDNGIKIRTYYLYLTRQGIKSQEEKKQKQKELDEKILKNHEVSGDVKQFCKENGIKRCTYNLHLKNLGLR